jgi:hypothetical protein
VRLTVVSRLKVIIWSQVHFESGRKKKKEKKTEKKRKQKKRKTFGKAGLECGARLSVNDSKGQTMEIQADSREKVRAYESKAGLSKLHNLHLTHMVQGRSIRERIKAIGGQIGL